MKVKTPEGIGTVIDGDLTQYKVDITEGHAHYIKWWPVVKCEIVEMEDEDASKDNS